MKKIVLLLMLVSGLFASTLKPTDDNELGRVGDYTFICADDTNKVWAVSKEEVNYKVLWVNINDGKEEWLNCNDYESYAAMYIAKPIE